jgi:hypothetical protein
MSVFAPEEYRAHLLVATDGLPVAQVEVGEVEGQERVRALVAAVVPFELHAWESEIDLQLALGEEWRHLRRGAPALEERLDLAGREVSLAHLLHRQIPTREISEIFCLDDESVRLRLAAFRFHLNRLFSRA